MTSVSEGLVSRYAGRAGTLSTIDWLSRRLSIEWVSAGRTTASQPVGSISALEMDLILASSALASIGTLVGSSRAGTHESRVRVMTSVVGETRIVRS